jgi:hypothetical protein
LISRPYWQKYFQTYSDPLGHGSDNNYEFYLDDAKLKILTYHHESVPIQFENRAYFLEFMSQITPHTSCLPSEAEKIAFMEELLDSYFQFIPPEEKGACKLIYTVAKTIEFKSNRLYSSRTDQSTRNL